MAERDEEVTHIALFRVGADFPRQGRCVASWKIYNTGDADRVVVRRGSNHQAYLLAGDTTFALPIEGAQAFASALGFSYEIEPAALPEGLLVDAAGKSR